MIRTGTDMLVKPAIYRRERGTLAGWPTIWQDHNKGTDGTFARECGTGGNPGRNRDPRTIAIAIISHPLKMQAPELHAPHGTAPQSAVAHLSLRARKTGASARNHQNAFSSSS